MLRPPASLARPVAAEVGGTDLAPTDPNGLVPNAAMTWGAAVKNGLAYVNDFNSGLYLVRMEPERGRLGP